MTPSRVDVAALEAALEKASAADWTRKGCDLLADGDIVAETASLPDAELIVHSVSAAPAFVVLVRAVREIHKPLDALNVRWNRVQQVCTGCGTDDGNWALWPCATEKALRSAVGAALNPQETGR